MKRALSRHGKTFSPESVKGSGDLMWGLCPTGWMVDTGIIPMFTTCKLSRNITTQDSCMITELVK